MAIEWFYQLAGETRGPVSAKELRALGEAGTVAADTLVRPGRDGRWVAARKVKGLCKPTAVKSSKPPILRRQPPHRYHLVSVSARGHLQMPSGIEMRPSDPGARVESVGRCLQAAPLRFSSCWQGRWPSSAIPIRMMADPRHRRPGKGLEPKGYLGRYPRRLLPKS